MCVCVLEDELRQREKKKNAVVSMVFNYSSVTQSQTFVTRAHTHTHTCMRTHTAVEL